MKKLLAFTVAAVVALSTASVFAGEGCGGGMSKTSAKGSCCSDMFSKLNLSADQKAKIAALKDQTSRAVSTSEAHAMFSAGLERILTPDQLAQFKEQCESSKASAKATGECPYMKSAKKS